MKVNSPEKNFSIKIETDMNIIANATLSMFLSSFPTLKPENIHIKKFTTETSVMVIPIACRSLS